MNEAKGKRKQKEIAKKIETGKVIEKKKQEIKIEIQKYRNKNKYYFYQENIF